MRLSSFAAVAAVVVARVFASPGVTFRSHEKRSVAPPEWIKRSTLDLKTVIPVRIALQQQNLENAEKFLWEVAHPKSPNYGKHWDARKIATTFAPR
jgi:tripeptidyl-peptidase-1